MLEETTFPSEDTGLAQPDQLSLRNKLLSWRTIAPLVVVVLLLALAARQVNLDLNLASMGAALAGANLWLVLAAFVAFYASLALRVVRWRLLLENVGYGPASGTRLPGFLPLANILYLSWFANDVVPARLGDLYRAYLLRQEADVSTTRTFGTVLAERIIDLIALLALFLGALLIALHGQLPAQVAFALQACLALVGALVVGLLALRLWREQLGRLVPTRLRAQYRHFQAGTLESFQRLHLLAPLTLVIWIVEALRFLFVALAVGLLGGSPAHIFAAAVFIALGESLLAAVPLTSGGLGFVEAGMFAMIWLFVPHSADSGAAQNLAGAAIVLDRLISLVSMLVFGGILFFFVVVLGKGMRGAVTTWRLVLARKGAKAPEIA